MIPDVGTTHIPGGFVLLARKMLASGLMDKPPLHTKLWCWLLLKASHKQHGGLKRGQARTSIEEMRRAMSWKVGARTVLPTRKEIRCAYEGLVKGTAVGITKVTHGMIITICNYDFYQNPSNYEGHDEGRSEKSDEGTIINKKGKQERNNPRKDSGASLADLRQRYQDQVLLDQTFAAIATTRKSGKVAESVIAVFLAACERYPVDQVEAGCRTYLEKGYAGQGKNEKYLAGIIRNGQAVKVPPTSTGGEWYENMGAI